MYGNSNDPAALNQKWTEEHLSPRVMRPLRDRHNVFDEHREIATASLIEVWIDETERRTWFLSETKHGA
jgi:DNA-binding ferritin-like protein